MVISFRLVVGQLTLKFEPVLINLTDCSQHNHIPHFGSIRLENPGVFLPGFLMLFVGHLGQIEYYSNLLRRLSDQFGAHTQTGNIQQALDLLREQRNYGECRERRRMGERFV